MTRSPSGKRSLIAGGLCLMLASSATVEVSRVAAFQSSASLSFPRSFIKENSNSHIISASTAFNTIDIEESTARDIGTMDEWASACGVQRAEGFQLTVTSSNNQQQQHQNDPMDVGVMTTENLSAGSPVLLVPSDMILSGRRAREELGPITNAEELLQSTQEIEHLPQWYLYIKVLTEYQRGVDSPWYPWLNSLPRYFSNGSSMTHLCCSECLPPLVGRLAIQERTRFSRFNRALKFVDFLDDSIRENRKLSKWAFAVVYTRLLEDVNTGDVKVVPMADMFNHGTEADATISFDGDGSCYVHTTCDVPAGSPLRVSYTGGDNTNPSYLFARYGFLEEDAPATFCKIMVTNPSPELVNMGYDHSKLLFYKDTGEVSAEVWDVLLYLLLEKQQSNNPELSETLQAFYQAHMTGDIDTKQVIHEQYYPQTLQALRDHVDAFLQSLEQLSNKAAGRDLNKHPRVPLIMKHNEFVKQTFLKVRARL